MQQELKVVGAKVTPEVEDRIEAIAAAHGTTKYRVIQNVIKLIIKLMDRPHDLNVVEQKMVDAFNDVAQMPVNGIDGEVLKEVSEAQYFVNASDKKSLGIAGFLVQKPFFDNRKVTMNAEVMLERELSFLFPSFYRRLRVIAEDFGSSSVLETLMHLVKEHQGDEDERTIETLFGDNERSEFGKIPAKAPFVRKRRDAPKEEQRIVFIEDLKR